VTILPAVFAVVVWDLVLDHAAGWAAVLDQGASAVLVSGWLPCEINPPDSTLVPRSTAHGTHTRVRRSSRMTRRDEIKLTLERIKVAKRLVAQQVEFIRLARKAGYEPVLAPATLERFRTQLSEQRAVLLRLTRSGGKRATAIPRASPSVRQRAA
jgi:hypothetical protein